MFGLAVFAGVGTAFVPTGSFTTAALDRPGKMDVVNQRGGALDLTVAPCVESNTPWWQGDPRLVTVENFLNTSSSATVSLQDGSVGTLSAAGDSGSSVSFQLAQGSSQEVTFAYDGNGPYPHTFDFDVSVSGAGVTAEATRSSEVRQDCSGAGTPTPTPVPGNSPPTADFTASRSGWGGFTLNLDGSPSSDPDGQVVAYDWDVGNDGDIDANGETASVFAWPNTEVRLMVTDDSGATDSVTMTV